MPKPKTGNPKPDDSVLRKVKHNILYAALGASGAMAGVTVLAQCRGGSCGACPGCAGIGICALLLALFHRLRR